MKEDNTTKNRRSKTAIALEYDPEDAAPKIIATGKGIVAEKIIVHWKRASSPIEAATSGFL